MTITETNEMQMKLNLISRLAFDYHTIWKIDYKKEMISLLRSNYEKSLKREMDLAVARGTYQHITSEYIKHFVFPEDRDKVEQFLIPKYLMAHLEEEDNYLLNFRRIDPDTGAVEWHQMIIIYIDPLDREEGMILGIRNIDQLILNHQEKEQQINYISSVVDSLRLIHETLNSGSWDMEFGEDGSMKSCHWSPVFRRMLGYDTMEEFPDELESWTKHLCPEDKEEVVRAYWDTVHDYSGKTIYDVKYRMRTKSNGSRWFHAAGRVSRREDGTPITFTGLFVDIDDRIRSQAKLDEINRKNQEQFRLLTSVAEMYFTMHLIDLEEDTVEEFSCDENISSFFKSPEGAIVIMRNIMSTVIEPQYRDEVLKFVDLTTIKKRMHNKKTLSGEFIGIHTGWFVATFIVIEQDSYGYPTKVMFTTQIIDEQKKKEETLILQSTTDELTGCYNRRAYAEQMDTFREFGIEEDMVFISLDVNRLKYVNDTFGHAAGDELIQGATEVMRQGFGEDTVIYRTGGDEFVAFLYADENMLREKCNAFQCAMKDWKGKIVQELAVSYGYVTAVEGIERGLSVDDIMKLADERMYENKNQFYKSSGFDRRRN